MGRRPGRKRKQNVVRFPCGKPVPTHETAIVIPFNTASLRLTGDGKLGNKIGLERVTDVLEILNITKSQRLAGQEWRSLRDACARHSWDSPNIHAKISNPHASHSHKGGEMDAEIIDLGQRLHRKYVRAVHVMLGSGRGVVPVVCSVCFENKMPTPDERPLLNRGLNALVDLWRL